MSSAAPTGHSLDANAGRICEVLPGRLPTIHSPQGCPFCGHPTPVVDEVDTHVWAVCCIGCEATGPLSRVSDDDALTLWAQRG